MKKTLVIALLTLVTLAGQAQENNYTAENKSKENCRKSLASKPISQPRRNHPAGLFFALLRLKCANCRISINISALRGMDFRKNVLLLLSETKYNKKYGSNH